MHKNIDKKTELALISALENVKAYGQQLQDRREKRLWKEIDVPCDLRATLDGLTKDQMDKIRKKFNFKNVSSLKKSELAAKLTELIPLKFRNALYTLDKSRYNIIKKIVRNSGVIPDIGMPMTNAEAFGEYGMVFCGIYEDKKVLFIPTELIDIFVQEDGSELERVVLRNTEWIGLTQGLLYYYGVMGVWTVIERIEKLTGEKIEFTEFIEVLSFAGDFYGQVSSTPYGYKDDRVFDARKIMEEHKMRQSVDYYPFTRKQLLKAGMPDYVDKTPEMNSFIRFLLDYYNLEEQETNEIASQIIYMINSDSEPTLIIQYLQSWIEFPSYQFVQVLTEQIMDLYNNTRQWVLKGHTPNELLQKEKNFLKPMPTKPFQAGHPTAKVIDFVTRTKIGRNDPCPCGSGKKYKRCCGR